MVSNQWPVITNDNRTMEPIALLIFATCFFFIQKLLGLITEFIVQLLVRYSNEFHKVKSLKQDRYDTNIAKNKLSPQDQYAKWTKLNRKVDQLNSEIDTAEKALQAKKDQLSSSTTLLKRLITLLGFLIKIWYRKTKVFYMPNVLPIPIVQWVWQSGVGVSPWLFLLGTFVSGVEFIYKELAV